MKITKSLRIEFDHGMIVVGVGRRVASLFYVGFWLPGGRDVFFTRRGTTIHGSFMGLHIYSYLVGGAR